MKNKLKVLRRDCNKAIANSNKGRQMRIKGTSINFHELDMLLRYANNPDSTIVTNKLEGLLEKYGL